jgi:hypothetical protein
MELQSGIVFAVIIGAVLLVDRLGGNDELARRLFQIALGVTLAYFVVSGTTFFIEPDAFGADMRKEANREVAVRSIEFSLGILSILFGVGGLRQWRTIPLGIALGGLLLLLLPTGRVVTGSGARGDVLFSQLLQINTQASRGIQFANFALSGIGFAALMWFGFSQWDREPEIGDEEGYEEGDAGSPA